MAARQKRNTQHTQEGIDMNTDTQLPDAADDFSGKPFPAPDPFDPQHLAVHGTVLAEAGVVKEMIRCPVRKPSKQEFVRVHPSPEFQMRAYILELKDALETYLIAPNVAAELPGETRLVTLLLATSRQGATFLWPVPEAPMDGRETDWAVSQRIAAGKAQESWVRMMANMGQGAYDVFVAPGALGTPNWPSKSMRDILEIAFGAKYIIRDAAHPVIRRLHGLE